jgi:type VI secretion system protein ImpF
MHPISHQTLISSSLLDRLMDDSPLVTTENQSEMLYDMTRYKRAVARDLESLLNTRCAYLGSEMLDLYPQAKDSILLFGITDLSSLSLLNPEDRMFLRDSIRKAIERYEPRLAKVRVNLEISKELHQVLRFRVDALLKVHPNRPPVTFDAMLQLSSNTYVVKD